MPVNANSLRTDAFRRACVEAGGAGMSKVSEYRQHPKECRVLAHRSRSSQHRDILAETWLPLGVRSPTSRAQRGCGPPPRRRASSPAAANYIIQYRAGRECSTTASTLTQGRPVFRGR